MAASLPWRRHEKPAELSRLAPDSGGPGTADHTASDDPRGNRTGTISTNNAIRAYIFDARNKLSPDPRFDALADDLTFIEQIEEDIVRFKTRLEHIRDNRLRRTVTADIKRLEKRRAVELKRLIARLRSHADLAERFELVLSIPGIGERTALALIVRMPELGRVSREQAAALAGLAPFVHQSGKRQGETHIGGGRSRLRRSLYAAALAASFRWNPALKALYARLIARGKSHNSALIACARKLLVFANTVVARGTPWVVAPAAA
jgi:transposase